MVFFPIFLSLFLMKLPDHILDYVSDACSTRARIVLVLRDNDEWYEGVVERIYNQKIIKFVASVPGRACSVTGFLLVSDILEVIY